MYVSLSGVTLNAIRAQIHSLRRAELNSLPNAEAVVKKICEGDALPKVVEERLRKRFGVSEDITAALRHLAIPASMQGRISVPVDALQKTYEAAKADEVVNFHTMVKIPCFAATIGGRYDTYRPEPFPLADFPDYYDELARAVALNKEAASRWDVVESGVIKLLESAKSLNEAVKLAPHIMPYVPDDLRARLEEKPERSKRSTADLEAAAAALDAEVLTASAVLGRMAQSGGGPVHG